MKCEPCTYSPEPVVDSLQTSFLDTLQLSVWSGTPTPAKSCENEQAKVGFQNCECGKEMSDCSIHPSSVSEWVKLMSSLADFHVKTFQSQGKKPDWETAHDLASTENYCGLLAVFNPNTSSLKTCQQSFLEDLNASWPTWPRWGFLQDGAVYAHPMSEQFMPETGGGFWPTPAARDWKGANGYESTKKKMSSGKRAQMGQLPNFVQMMEGRPIRGTLNPRFVEWLMMFPIGFTVSKHLVTRKSRSKQQSRGNSSEGRE